MQGMPCLVFSMDPANKDITKNYNELIKQEHETLRLTPKQFLDRLFKEQITQTVK